MRFYSSSTKPPNGQEIASLSTLINKQGGVDPVESKTLVPQHFLSFSRYCQELIEVSNKLNIQLLRNNHLLELRQRLPAFSPPEDCSQVGSEKGRASETVDSRKSGFTSASTGSQDGPEDQGYIQGVKPERPKKRKKMESSEEDSYHPAEQDFHYEEPGFSRISQSKNIPKNYSKAIINYIKHHHCFTRRVLDHLGQDYDQFMIALQKLGGHVSSIAQLKQLWTDQTNQFAKAYRILSMEYLRKHCLGYIFNSRVNIYSKHIKYRAKMIEGVSCPDKFTCMKQF